MKYSHVILLGRGLSSVRIRGTQLEMVLSCVENCYLASVSNALGISVDNRVLGPQRIQRFTGNALRISFHSDWQINNGFFNRPITARTQILVLSWAQNKDFGAVSQTGLTRV